MGYTWAQFTAYLRLARQERARQRLERMADTNAAFAGGEGARKLHRALSDQAAG
jgi:hypothetical protein